MVSQLLFGEMAELLETKGDFCKIKALYDNYEGWCQLAQLHETELQESPQINLAADWVNDININGQTARIPFGSSLSFLKNNRAEIGNFYIEYTGGCLATSSQNLDTESLQKICFPFLNTPYLWGGRSVFGIDCSGFTQLVFKCFNTYLHRDASQQAGQGESVGFLQEVQPGDLAFFDNVEGKIIHVGILLDSNTIIHASGKVRIDTIDNIGIVNTDTGKRTHNLRVIKRMR